MSKELSKFQILVSSPGFAFFTSIQIHAITKMGKDNAHKDFHVQHDAKKLAVWNSVFSFMYSLARLPRSHFIAGIQFVIAISLLGVGLPYAIIHHEVEKTWKAQRNPSTSICQHICLEQNLFANKEHSRFFAQTISIGNIETICFA